MISKGKPMKFGGKACSSATSYNVNRSSGSIPRPCGTPRFVTVTRIVGY
jgi:hypothetical protein